MMIEIGRVKHAYGISIHTYGIKGANGYWFYDRFNHDGVYYLRVWDFASQKSVAVMRLI